MHKEIDRAWCPEAEAEEKKLRAGKKEQDQDH